MKRISLLSLLVYSFSVFGQGRSVPFEKSLFKDRKDEFKIAVDHLKNGNTIYEEGPLGWWMAIEEFEEANAFNPKNAELNYKLGNCYLNSNYKSKALEFFKTAYKLDPAFNEDIHFKLGKSNHIQSNFDEAINEFTIHLNKLAPSDLDNVKLTQKYIRECKTGRKMVENPTRVFLDNLGPNVNSKYPDYAGLISADESVMIFTTRRPSETNKELVGGMYYEDVFISEKDENGKWQKATSISPRINTKNHDATSGLSPDGLTLFLYYNSGKDNGNLYQSVKEEDGWSKPKDLGKNINTDYSWETGASLSYDGKKLYFVSTRAGTRGGRDIWFCNWDEKKEDWGKPENLGAPINTEYDEVGVFMHPDGKTMYFSSDGHKGMGGFDIYSSILQEDGTWGMPKNIGYPVCTPDHDIFFSISASGKHAYYASFREDGEGEKDLYMITLLGEEKEPLLSGEDNLLASVTKPVEEELMQTKVNVSIKNLSLLKGKVLDAVTKQPIKSYLELVDNVANEKVSTSNTDAQTGKFLLSLPAGRNYGIAVKSEGYLFHSENFDIPANAGYKEYEKIIYMKKIKVGESIVLRNIFFDLDKSTLKQESKTELDRLNKLMIENPTLKIELSGHTDTQGSATYNVNLSKERAKVVVEYLVQLGIDANRFESAGYGETKPIITDAEIAKMKSISEKKAANAQNRRTEFKILEF